MRNLSFDDIRQEIVKESFPPDGMNTIDGKVCDAPRWRNIDVPPGQFSVTGNESVPCPQGFWCPGGTPQPIYCCAGFYCPTPAEIRYCPEGSYCPMGSTEPESCHSLAVCPPATEAPIRIGIILVIGSLLLIVALAFKIKNRMDLQNAIRNRLQVEMVKKSRSQLALNATHGGKAKSLDIEFDNLEFKLNDGSKIMENVSGFFQSGKMTAVMGPSGAGKTTLFSLLTGKAKKTKGSILLNGKREDLGKYRKLVGYVPQDDIMLRELTVDDILMHSANMRLPTSMKAADRRKRVVSAIENLGLGHVINTPIGDEESRGISGGQRKRVNIGMELVADPSVLFLDEPTSGLDSSTALELCQILAKLAKIQRMTIAAVIHSPSPSTLLEFNDILLLGKGGKVVYFGPTKGIMHYFTQLGFDGENQMNPADFAMDVISGKIPCSWDSDFHPDDLFVFWDCYQSGTPIDRIRHDKTVQKKTMRRKEKKPGIITSVFTSFFTIIIDSIEWVMEVIGEFIAFWVSILRFFTFVKDPVRDTPNLFKSYFYLLKRAFRQQFKSRKRFIFDLLIHFIAGLIVSGAIQEFQYLGRQPDEVCDVSPFVLRPQCNNPVDSLNFAGMVITVGILFAGQATSIHTFGRENVVYWRDVSSGMSSLAYFLAKFTADIPRIVIASFMYTVATLILFDYRGRFAYLMLNNMCLYFAAFNMGYFLSVVVTATSVGLVTAGNSLFWAFLLSGVQPNLKAVMEEDTYTYVRFLWNWSAPRWAVEAFYIEELTSRSWSEVNVTPYQFRENSFPHAYERGNYWVAIMETLKLALVWGILSFLALKLANRRKQK